jgi:hypothetical protein
VPGTTSIRRGNGLRFEGGGETFLNQDIEVAVRPTAFNGPPSSS